MKCLIIHCCSISINMIIFLILRNITINFNLNINFIIMIAFFNLQILSLLYGNQPMTHQVLALYANYLIDSMTIEFYHFIKNFSSFNFKTKC